MTKCTPLGITEDASPDYHNLWGEQQRDLALRNIASLQAQKAARDEASALAVLVATTAPVPPRRRRRRRGRHGGAGVSTPVAAG